MTSMLSVASQGAKVRLLIAMLMRSLVELWPPAVLYPARGRGTGFYAGGFQVCHWPRWLWRNRREMAALDFRRELRKPWDWCPSILSTGGIGGGDER
jgi:hypothetical protein